jgi:hypothetical protein
MAADGWEEVADSVANWIEAVGAPSAAPPETPVS